MGLAISYVFPALNRRPQPSAEVFCQVPPQVEADNAASIRLEDDQYARLSILSISKLAGEPLTDTIRNAVEAHIERLAASADVFSARAQKRARSDRPRGPRAAFTSLFGEGTKTDPAASRTTSPAKP